MVVGEFTIEMWGWICGGVCGGVCVHVAMCESPHWPHKLIHTQTSVHLFLISSWTGMCHADFMSLDSHVHRKMQFCEPSLHHFALIEFFRAKLKKKTTTHTRSPQTTSSIHTHTHTHTHNYYHHYFPNLGA